MYTAKFRFYAELNDFLPPDKRQRTFTHAFELKASVKDMIEALGVPHTEIDLILVNGQSVDFSYLVQDGDRISVYPVFESLDITPLIRLRPQPLRETRFVLDVHLGRLATYLRMLGFDTLYRNDYADAELASISSNEGRILLTRDRGLPSMTIVGLPDAAVQESRERVRSAIKNSGLRFPSEQVTVNLAPADIRKAEPVYDLPIAIDILMASEQIYGDTSQAIIMGELSLDRGVRHVSGMLPMTKLAEEEGFTTLFVPAENAPETSLVEGLTVCAVESLPQLVDHLTKRKKMSPYEVDLSPTIEDLGTTGDLHLERLTQFSNKLGRTYRTFMRVFSQSF